MHYYLDGMAVDHDTRARVVVDVEHYEIHRGESYSAQYTITTAATTGHRSEVYIKTPADRGIHLIASFSVSTAGIFYFCEAPTIAAGTGTGNVAIYNRKRDETRISALQDNSLVPNSNKITTLSQAQINGDGTFATGTVIRTEPLTVGAGPRPAGGDAREAQEYILKKNTAYVFLIANTANLANAHYIQIDWYELIE